jgi:basic membrane protein A
MRQSLFRQSSASAHSALKAWLLGLFALAACTIMLVLAFPARAQEPWVVLIYEQLANVQDNGFNEMANRGAMRANKELGIRVVERTIPQGVAWQEFYRDVAREKPSMIITVGFAHVRPLLDVADEFPQTKFTSIDGLVPPVFPNMQSVIFKDHEGAFLVGIIASLASPRGKIGFIGGMDIPLIRNFSVGYAQGARFAVPKIQVDQAMIGDDPTAWNNPIRATSLAQTQYEAGSDVIFAAAGASSVAVLETAKKQGKLAIGVDTNQNGLFPGFVLTSMVKRVDMAVFETIKSLKMEKWEPGIKYLGIKEDAVDVAIDSNNEKLITKSMKDRVDTAKALIKDGLLKVDTYSP